MFTIASQSDHYSVFIPRLTIKSGGKIYSIDRDGIPYLEIEISPESWNPFNAECFFQQFFCIGNGDEVCFINLQTKEVKTVLCDLYLGYFYVCKDKLFVASASRLLCFNSDCELLWQTEKLAVDGLLVDQFSEDSISVSCEIDPPDHWIKYRLSIDDGSLLGDFVKTV